MVNTEEKLQEELKKHGIVFEVIPHVWPGNCFGCSPRNEKGLGIKVSLEGNKVISYTIVSEHYCGFDRILHGGIIATLLDEISAFTITLLLARTGVTTEAIIRFHKPIMINTVIRVEGQITEFKNKKAIVTSNIKDIDGVLLAECKTTFLLPEISSLAKLVNMDENKLQEMVNVSISAVENMKKKDL